MAGVNVVVSGGGTIVASVDGAESTIVEVSGGVGPAAAVDTNSGQIVGVNPVSIYAGTNVTVSGNTSSYTISGVSNEYISGLSPVQSVQGKSGNVVIVATDITAGVFDVARIPVLPSQMQVVSTGSISSVTLTQQGDIAAGTIVTTVDGKRWVYSGSGSKTTESNYVELADVTPDWSVISNKPSSFSPSVHTHSTTEVSGLTTAIRSFANVVSVQGRTGTVTLTVADLSAAASSHTHSTANITSFATEAAKYGPVSSVNAKTGTVTLTISDLTAAAASHTHSTTDVASFATEAAKYGPVSSVNAKTGTVTLTINDLTAAAATHTHSTANITSFTTEAAKYGPVSSVNAKTGTVTLTISDLTAAAAVHTHSTTDVVGLTATIQSFGKVLSVQGKTSDVVLSAAEVGAAAAVHTHSATDVVGLTATIQQYGKVLSVQGKTADVVLSAAEVGAAAEVHSHATTDIQGFQVAVQSFANSAAEVSVVSVSNVENNLSASGDIIRVASAYPSSITGLAGGERGILKLITNVGAGLVTIKADDTRSVDSNRIVSPYGDFPLQTGESISCWYDDQSSRWRIIDRSLADGEASLPTQSGNGGKVVVTDGTSASWVSRFSIIDPVLVAGTNVSLVKNTTDGTIQIDSAGGGGGSGASLSSSTPMPLGIAAAGSSGEASRADHVHPLPTFPVSSINGTTGAIQIVAGGNVTVQTVGNTVTLSTGVPLPSQSLNAGRVVGTDGTTASWVTRYSVVDPVLSAGANVSLTRNSTNGTIQIAATGGGGGGGGLSIWPSIIFG